MRQVLDCDPPPLLSSLADPRRWRLVRELAGNDRRVGELTEALGLPQNLVSYHLGELRRAGIVRSRRSSADGRDVYYSADLDAIRLLFVGAASAVHPGVDLAPTPHAAAARRGTAPRVLFLCTGNSARSQMAEALLRRRAGGAADARSAGSSPKALHPHAVTVMRKRGIDIADARTKHLRRFARTRFARVVTLCDKVREICPELPGPAPVRHWSMPDPSLSPHGIAAFEAIADELEQRIDFLIAELFDPIDNRRTA